MLLRPITIATALHFFAAALVWFCLFGVVLGLGFKDDWTTYDYIYAYAIRWLSYIVCFPAIWVAGTSVGFLVIPVQLASSFVQANIVLAVWKHIAGRNKPVHPSADAPAD